jgi:hypothetical protein
MSNIDWNPVIQVIAPVVATLLMSLLGYVVMLMKQRLNLAENSAAALALNNAVQQAGGLAYTFLAKQANGAAHSDAMQSAAVSIGVNHVANEEPAAMKLIGKTNADISVMVQGEVGKLLAADPTVSIGPTVKPVVVAPVQIAPETKTESLTTSTTTTGIVP